MKTGTGRGSFWAGAGRPGSRRFGGAVGALVGCLVALSLLLPAVPAAAAAPANDDFANAEVLRGKRVTVQGTTDEATRQDPGEPDHYTTVPGDSESWVGDRSVWYRWKAPESGKVTIHTCAGAEGQVIDSILAVYTGSELASLTRVTDNNNNCPNYSNGQTNWGSKVTFRAKKGTVYRIAVAECGGLRELPFTLSLKLR